MQSLQLQTREEGLPSNSRTLPFLKWAGGKRWLTKNYSELFPTEFNRYIEPFAGSAAVFFHLSPKSAILADINQDLISSYEAIKNDWRQVFSFLEKHHKEHEKDYYYRIREKGNSNNPFENAANFIYLNRTCWNGLYRVNLKGKFNVPVGTKDKVILESDNFSSVASMLEDTLLCCNHFSQTIQMAKEGDFLFVDPPYTVNDDKSGFIQYNKNLFAWEEQVKLAEQVKQAAERGVKIMVTNAYHPSLLELYKGVGEHLKLNRHNVLAGKKEFRGRYNELIVRTY